MVLNLRGLDKYDIKHAGSWTHILANNDEWTDKKDTKRKDTIIILLNDGNRGVTEHHSLLTRMDTCIDTGDILGTNSPVGTLDTRIYLVQINNIFDNTSKIARRH